MPPSHGLVHPKEYDIKDSNVELIGSELDHKVKHNSALAEPAWRSISSATVPTLLIWRIEDFQVIPWPQAQYGHFYDGDSYIVLYKYKLGKQNTSSSSSGGTDGDDDDDEDKVRYDIYFWLGAHTTQDEAGTAAYKTVELDEFLNGKATQHRETQACPSESFLSLFPRLTIRKGGVRTGFTHVVDEPGTTSSSQMMLVRVFKNPGASGASGVGASSSLIVAEVEPTWRSLDEGDVFILEEQEGGGGARRGPKIWVWQGKNCSPMEKAKAAQVVHDMTLAKHVDTEVVAQSEARSRRVVTLLSADDEDEKTAPMDGFRCPRPIVPATHGGSSRTSESHEGKKKEVKKLYRLSDASGDLTFDLVKEGDTVSLSDFDEKDVFVLDDAGATTSTIWVWEGSGASRTERSMWLQVVQRYLNKRAETVESAWQTPVAKVRQGHEGREFLRAVRV